MGIIIPDHTLCKFLVAKHLYTGQTSKLIWDGYKGSRKPKILIDEKTQGGRAATKIILTTKYTRHTKKTIANAGATLVVARVGNIKSARCMQGLMAISPAERYGVWRRIAAGGILLRLTLASQAGRTILTVRATGRSPLHINEAI